MNTKILVATLSACFIVGCNSSPGVAKVSEQLPEVAPVQDLSKARSISSTVKVATSDAAPVLFTTRFKMASTYDLFFAVDISNLAEGSHHIDLELTAPNGMIYQSLPVDFLVPAGSKTTRVWASIPVAGTLIEQMQLVGKWKASAFINYAGSASSSAAFTLN